MSMTKITIGTIVRTTGLTNAQVKYRIKMIGIDGMKVQPNITLYDYSDIKKIGNWSGSKESQLKEKS